jgi:hypothetical protein
MLGLDAYGSSDEEEEEVQKTPFVEVRTWIHML